MTTRYFKAVTRTVVSSRAARPRRFYARAFVRDGGTRSNWASAGCTPAEVSRYNGEICEAVEITAKDYRELNKPANLITVLYTAVDGAGKRRTFKTRFGAWKFAVQMVGRNPTIGSNYAVSDDGIGKIEAGIAPRPRTGRRCPIRRTTMAGYSSILEAVKEGDVQIVEMSRAQARSISNIDTENDDTDLSDKIVEALDEAQGEADEEGKATYVVIKINGGPL